MATLAGLVLAGGASSRFGADKALAVVDGVTLLDRAVACLRAVCDGPVVIASGDGRSRVGVGDRQVPDLVADAGPLSAIAAGLEDVREEARHVAVLAVDHVAPSAELFDLLAARAGSRACVAIERDGRLQPLHAVWSTAVADDLATAVEEGARGVIRWLRSRDDLEVVGDDELAAAGIDPVATVDADVPGDLPGRG